MSELRWTNALDLTLEGQGWPDESEHYCRLPRRAEGVVRSEVWRQSLDSAGLRVRFVSDASRIGVRWKLRHPIQPYKDMSVTSHCGVDLYARDETGKWRYAKTGTAPDEEGGEIVLLDDITPGEREYSLYLPIYNGATSLEIGVPEEASVKSAPPLPNKSVVGFYGTSINQGGCASRAGMAHIAILGRRLDCLTINLGWAGNAMSEIEMAQFLAELKVDVWVIDPLPNMTAAQVSERIRPLVDTIRRALPDVPIILIENITYADAWLHQGRRSRMENSNIELRKVYEGMLADGIQSVTYVPGQQLLGEDGEGTTDGTHPNDLGFMRMADVLEPPIRMALG
jgi:lysophospholipase L1-like esterase